MECREAVSGGEPNSRGTEVEDEIKHAGTARFRGGVMMCSLM